MSFFLYTSTDATASALQGSGIYVHFENNKGKGILFEIFWQELSLSNGTTHYLIFFSIRTSAGGSGEGEQMKSF